MRKGKRVTGTLGLMFAAAGVVGLVTAACEPTYNPDQEGPPSVVKVVGFLPDDPTVNTNLYVADNPNCEYDNDGGAYDVTPYAGPTWGFRIVLSELLDGDEVEALDDAGLGSEAYSGFVQITTPEGGTVTSTLDPTLQLTPDTISSVYQPAGGNGCYNTFDGFDLDTGNPIPGPAFISYLAGVPSLPSNSELTLWLKKEAGGHKIVDTGGASMAADFSVSFTTDPMFVDCASIDACNTMPSVFPDDQPQDPLDPDLGFDMVTVQLTAPIGDPSGLFLYEMTGDPATPTLVADQVPEIDADITDSLFGGVDSAVSITLGLTEDGYNGITFTPGATYWIVATSDILDLWGVPAEVTDVADADGNPLDPCGDAAAAGITVDNCIWAGTFTVAEAV
jgi:hypothetical protein